MRNLALALVYYLVVTPYGVLRRRLRDPMARRWDPRASSYFVRTHGA